MNKNIIIGIYKLTSPTNKIYIGQSINILKRWDVEYKGLFCKNQYKLYNSFKKHGVKNHQFEIIEECSVEQLNERERYWQDFYDVLGDRGLNCKLTTTKDRSGYISQEIKNKISKAALGHTKNSGHKHSKETKEKMSESAIGNSKKEGYKMSENSKKEIGYKNSKPKPNGFGSNRHYVILQYDLEGNFIKEWEGIMKTKKLFKGDIVSCCSGRQKTAGGFIWRYKNDFE